jgi:hypothetical protein
LRGLVPVATAIGITGSLKLVVFDPRILDLLEPEFHELDLVTPLPLAASTE